MTPGDTHEKEEKPTRRKTPKRKLRNRRNSKPESVKPVGTGGQEVEEVASRMDSGQPALGVYQPAAQRNLLQEILTWKKLELMQSPSVQKWLKETQLNIALSKPQDLIKSLEEAIGREKAEHAQAPDPSDSNSEGAGAEDPNGGISHLNTNTKGNGATTPVPMSDCIEDTGEPVDKLRSKSVKKRRRSQPCRLLRKIILPPIPRRQVDFSQTLSKMQLFDSEGARSSGSAFESGKMDSKDTSQECSVFVPSSSDASDFEPSAFQPGTSQVNTLQLKAIRDSISKSGASSSLSTASGVQQSTASSLFVTESVVSQSMTAKTSVARMLKFSERNQFKPVQQGNTPCASPDILTKQQPGTFPQTTTSQTGIKSSQNYPLLRDQLATPEKTDARPLKETCNLLSGLLSQPDSVSSLNPNSSQQGLTAQLQQEPSSLSALDLAAIFAEDNTPTSSQTPAIYSAPASPTDFKEQLQQARQLLQNYQAKAGGISGTELAQMAETMGQQNQSGMDDFFAFSAPTVQGSCAQGGVPVSPVEMYQPQQDFGMSSLNSSQNSSLNNSLNPSPVNITDHLSGNMNFGVANPETSTKFDNFAVPAPPTPTMGIYTKHENVMTQQESIMTVTRSQNMLPVHSRLSPVSFAPDWPRRNTGSDRGKRDRAKALRYRERHLRTQRQQNLPMGQQNIQQSFPQGQQNLLHAQTNLSSGQQGLAQGHPVGLHTGLPQVAPMVQRTSSNRGNLHQQAQEIPSTSSSGLPDWQWPLENQNQLKPASQTSQMPGQRVSLESLLARSQADQQQPISLQRTGSQDGSNQWLSSNPGQDMI